MQRFSLCVVAGLLLVTPSLAASLKGRKEPGDLENPEPDPRGCDGGKRCIDVGMEAEELDADSFFGVLADVPLVESGTGKVIAPVQMRFAGTPDQDHRGLMFRQHLGENEGMLFLYTQPSRRVLWMKNTLVGLDAGWFTGDGVLQEVHQMPPLDLKYRWSDREDITMGLEMPVGWFERRGLKPGDVQLDQKALATALSARGLDASQYVDMQRLAASAKSDLTAVEKADSAVDEDYNAASGNVDAGKPSALLLAAQRRWNMA
jgi:uncharacterized membrane protein (UPF0127 family)